MQNASIWNDTDKTTKENLKQSCAVAQIATGLIDVMWQYIQEDLPSLVRLFEIGIVPSSWNRIPKIFISYTWEDEIHNNWVRFIFAEALVKYFGKENIIIDKDNIFSHSDAFQFMEQSIVNSDIYISICSQSYKEKADNRLPSIGEEARLISHELSLNKKSAIPLIRKGDKSVSIPNFLSGRIFIDFTDDVKFEQSILDLLRAINLIINNI